MEADRAGFYNTHGHKLRVPPPEKAQFVTECGIGSNDGIFGGHFLQNKRHYGEDN